MTTSRRLLTLLALLPPLLVLGIGGGVYVCLERGGEAHLQIAAESCCEGVSSPSSGDARNEPAAGGAGDCRSCRDVTLVPDVDVRRTPDRAELDPGSQALAAAFAGVRPGEWTEPARRRAMVVVRDREPPALLHLRTVVIRC